MTKSRKLISGLVLIVAGLLLAAWLMFRDAAGGIGLTYENEIMYTAGDTKIDSPVDVLDVDWTEGRVNILYHEGSEILVSETSPKQLRESDRLRWWLDGKTLHIRYAQSGVRLSLESLQKTLTVSLPEGTALTKAGVSVTSADIRLDHLVAGELVLSSTSGDTAASAVTKNLSASSTSGNMDLTLDQGADAVRLSSTSGRIACAMDHAITVSAESTSGAIALSMTEGAETVKTHSTSGSAALASPMVKNADLSSTSGGVSVALGALENLKIDTTSGSVAAKLPAEPGLTCRISTTSGSFSSGIELAKNGDTYTCGDGSGRVSIGTTSGSVRIEQAE